jgi:hypothetical protein
MPRHWEGQHVQRGGGVRWIGAIVGFLGLVAPAAGQTPSANTLAQFDGTYAFVSGTKANETFHHGTGQCPAVETLGIGQLTIVNGHVHFSSPGGVIEGTINSQGQIATQGMNSRSLTKITGTGKIDGDGTINLHSVGWYCDQDLVWRRTANN